MDGRFDSARSGGNYPELAIASHAYRKKLLYDPIDDFIPISLIDKGSYLLAVHRTVPATSVREPIDLLDRRVIRVQRVSAALSLRAFRRTTWICS